MILDKKIRRSVASTCVICIDHRVVGVGEVGGCCGVCERGQPFLVWSTFQEGRGVEKVPY